MKRVRIEKVARFVASMSNAESIEVLSFHQMGAFKWKMFGLDYKLANTLTPTDSQIRAALDIFRGAGSRAR